jgi:nucleotide-binding universal stress UspA family protein
LSKAGWKLGGGEVMSASPIENILLHVEASEAGLVAARYAVALAKAYAAKLHAVYVVNEKMLGELLSAKVFLEEEEVDLERDLEEDGRRYLSAVERLADDKGVALSTDLAKGVVHREIVDKATQIGASLIIIGEIEEPASRRDTFFDEGEMILRLAKCPVLTVKGDDFVRSLYDSA